MLALFDAYSFMSLSAHRSPASDADGVCASRYVDINGLIFTQYGSELRSHGEAVKN